MKRIYVIVLFCVAAIAMLCLSFKTITVTNPYQSSYQNRLDIFTKEQQSLVQTIEQSNIHSSADLHTIKAKIDAARIHMKTLDFWMRYLEPVKYKKVNGPLPVEWETEVFEKFEKPYKREGAGLTLAALYLEEENIEKDSLANLIRSSVDACATFAADSITDELKTYHHFFLANRLYLLNLSAIYTTGFECPDTTNVIPELKLMLADVAAIYKAFNTSFPETALSANYMDLYQDAIAFVNQQSSSYSAFDHFLFIKNYINPLFKLNQGLLVQYKVLSKSFVDYSLNKNAVSIFDKTLYRGQNSKGVFLRVTDPKALAEIDHLGKMFFYDPILSGNNKRSCASCHKGTQYFTDTAVLTSLQYDHKNDLERNTPSLINAGFNHLVMLDGKHISLQNQTKDVIGNAREMGSNEKEVLKKVLSCGTYKNMLNKLLTYTPQEPEITVDHMVSAITLYYSKFSSFYAPFDEAINNNKPLNISAQKGFNLFRARRNVLPVIFYHNLME